MKTSVPLPPPSARKTSLWIVAGLCLGLCFGCSHPEQTTDADVKAANANQVPDPNAAKASSPMGDMKKGPGGKAPGP